MKVQRTNSREKILAAAADVARETGPGSLSLDAVAARAGVSKGGLLYNFPTKAKLLQALVEDYLCDFQQSLDEAAADGDGKENLLSLYVRLSARECEENVSCPSWIFSAVAEDPDFLEPIKIFRRQLFNRLKSETPDLRVLLVTYLAIEGMRSMNLFDSKVLSSDERQLLVSSLLAIARSEKGLDIGPAGSGCGANLQ